MRNQGQWREWDLQGLEVTQISFDHRLQIYAWSPERALMVVFGSPFTLLPADESVLSLDPEQTENLCPLLSLLFRQLAWFRASSDGQCRLGFTDGAELACLPDERFEAWESQGTGALADASLLCAPGGGSPWGDAQ